MYIIDTPHRRVRKGGGGALGARAPPARPTWEKGSAQKCSKEERKFRPDMSAKKECARSAQIPQH